MVSEPATGRLGALPSVSVPSRRRAAAVHTDAERAVGMPKGLLDKVPVEVWLMVFSHADGRALGKAALGFGRPLQHCVCQALYDTVYVEFGAWPRFVAAASAGRMNQTTRFAGRAAMGTLRAPAGMQAFYEVIGALPSTLREFELTLGLDGMGARRALDDDAALVRQVSSVLSLLAERVTHLRAVKLLLVQSPFEDMFGLNETPIKPVLAFSAILASIPTLDRLMILPLGLALDQVSAPGTSFPFGWLATHPSPTVETMDRVRRIACAIVLAPLLLSWRTPLTHCCLYGLAALQNLRLAGFRPAESPALAGATTLCLVFDRPLDFFASPYSARLSELARCVSPAVLTLEIRLDREDIAELRSRSRKHGAVVATRICVLLRSAFSALFEACPGSRLKTVVFPGMQKVAQERLLAVERAIHEARADVTVEFDPPCAKGDAAAAADDDVE